MSISYFDGVSFIGVGDDPDHAAVQKDRFFDGYYGIQYNHAGMLEFSVGDNPRRLYDGPCAFITRPGMKFYYGAPAGASRHHAFVCFKGPRVEKFIRDGLLTAKTGQAPVRIVNAERFLSTLRELIANIKSNPPRNYCRAALLLEDLLLQLHEQPPEKPEISGHLTPGLRHLADAMEQKPQLEWNFHLEAVALGVSYPHFRRIFRQYAGVSPVNHLIKCRLRNAVRLLLHSDDQISAIAENCGIPDPFYFSRLFKKYYNLPPNIYRREFKNRPAALPGKVENR